MSCNQTSQGVAMLGCCGPGDLRRKKIACGANLHAFPYNRRDDGVAFSGRSFLYMGAENRYDYNGEFQYDRRNSYLTDPLSPRIEIFETPGWQAAHNSTFTKLLDNSSTNVTDSSVVTTLAFTDGSVLTISTILTRPVPPEIGQLIVDFINNFDLSQVPLGQYWANQLYWDFNSSSYRFTTPVNNPAAIVADTSVTEYGSVDTDMPYSHQITTENPILLWTASKASVVLPSPYCIYKEAGLLSSGAFDCEGFAQHPIGGRTEIPMPVVPILEGGQRTVPGLPGSISAVFNINGAAACCGNPFG